MRQPWHWRILSLASDVFVAVMIVLVLSIVSALVFLMVPAIHYIAQHGL